MGGANNVHYAYTLAGIVLLCQTLTLSGIKIAKVKVERISMELISEIHFLL